MSEPFEAFVGRHAGSVRQIVLRILRRVEDVDDLVQDVFLQAWLQRHRFDPARGSEAAWLTTIARSRSYDHLRAHTRRRALAARHDPASGEQADSLWGGLDQERVGLARAALAGLTQAQRDLLAMSYHDDLSHTQIAGLLRQPLGTVKTRLRDSVGELRHRTARQGAGAPAPAAAFESCSGAFTIGVTDLRPGAWTLFNLDDRVREELKGLRVVVVDDDSQTRALIMAVLSRFDVAASAHASADRGLSAMERSWPDVLLADLDMPVDDGYALIARARVMSRERGARLPVVAFTGCVSEQERSRTAIAGFDAYLTKPLHPLALLTTVAALGQRAAA